MGRAFVNKGAKLPLAKRIKPVVKKFFKRLKTSVKEMWKGQFKHSSIAGKALIIASLGSTFIGTVLPVVQFKSKVKNPQIIDPSKKVYES